MPPLAEEYRRHKKRGGPSGKQNSARKRPNKGIKPTGEGPARSDSQAIGLHFCATVVHVCGIAIGIMRAVRLGLPLLGMGESPANLAVDVLLARALNGFFAPFC